MDLSEFAARFCGVDQDILLQALLSSGNARGYILGAVSELILGENLKKWGYEVLRIREKWEGEKKHHGDYYVRYPGKQWYVIESKGVKSNSEKWHKIKDAPVEPEQLSRWFKRKRGEFREWWDSLDALRKEKIISSRKFKESRIIETHFVSGTAGRAGRTIATPKKTEFHIVSLDLFLRTGKHEFIFASSSELAAPQGHPDHLKQNYLIDIIVPTVDERPTLRKPWTGNFNEAFARLDNPISEKDMQVDTRQPGRREVGIEDLTNLIEDIEG
jgi:hypothetical protein